MYLQCPDCSLVYVPSRYYLSRASEKERYDSHRNQPDDPGYRNFLNRIVSPLISLLQPKAQGLDYGSGPEPVLSLLMAEKGFSLKNYDLFYANDKTLLGETYDFLVCSETIEHFHNPRTEWELFLKLVKNPGWIAIMTEMLRNETNFSSWYYKADKTHVCFYSKKTFDWLAEKYDLEAEFFGTSVIVFKV